jgi:hypothetical protein
MGILGLFSRPDIVHPELGRLRWRRGLWIGSLNELEVRLHGGKSGPSVSDVARLSEAIANLVTLKQTVAPKVFEHYEAYKNADSSGLILGTDEPLPKIGEPNAVWEHTFEHVLRIGPYTDASEVELCFMVAWDIEHTLGALFKGSELVELCGSILLPRA